jgi:hypothetical protein
VERGRGGGIEPRAPRHVEEIGPVRAAVADRQLEDARRRPRAAGRLDVEVAREALHVVVGGDGQIELHEERGARRVEVFEPRRPRRAKGREPREDVIEEGVIEGVIIEVVVEEGVLRGVEDVWRAPLGAGTSRTARRHLKQQGRIARLDETHAGAGHEASVAPRPGYSLPMRVHPRPLAWATALGALVLGSGCPRPEGLEGIPVGRAVLTDLFFAGIATFGGVRAGSAKLDIEEPDGTPHFFDVSVRGFIAGPMLDLGFSSLQARGEFDLSRIESPRGSDLLGFYEGFVAEGSMLIGGAHHDLVNDRNARVELSGFVYDIGMSGIVGHEWLTFDLAPEDPEAPDAGPIEQPVDAGSPDAGLGDGGLEDGGLEDGGLEDGGLEDGGREDGGLAEDAGFEDAGPVEPDAGAPPPPGADGGGGP